VIFWLLVATLAAQPARISGIVTDVSGAPIAGAVLRLHMADGNVIEGASRPDGTFELQTPAAGTGTFSVRSDGFAPETISLRLPRAEPLRIVLHPAAITEVVSVSAPIATRRGLDRADATVLTSATLATAAPPLLDDVLRSVPGFQLFRRSSSRVSNPTTQGASLRGLSSSGASRALVLADNTPLNDPFGGWVHWNEIPAAAVDRIEVARGGASDVYGGAAVSGVVQVVTRDPERRAAHAALEGGALGTFRSSGWLAGSRAGWNGAVSAERFETDGYILVPERVRGAVDTPAASSYTSALVIAGRQWNAGGRARVRASLLDEDRANGTPQQVNDTNARRVVAEAGGVGARGVWSARLSYGAQRYDQTFSAIADDRSRETLNRLQRVPSETAAAVIDWTRRGAGREWIAGLDIRRTRATSNETPITAGRAGAVGVSGGTDRLIGAFAQTSLLRARGVDLIAGTRVDTWRVEGLDGATHERTRLSPRVAVSARLSPVATIRASTYSSFRPPTLNELYRGFRVGNVITLANAALKPERLTGGEAGLLVTGARTSGRGTVYWTRLADAVTNVTLSTAGTTTTRQRMNADRVRASGVEWEQEARLSRQLTATAGLAWTRSLFANGLRVPQVPRLQANAGFRFVDPRIATVSFQLRHGGTQFEDDRNELKMDSATTVDLHASRQIVRGLQAFVAIENAFDDEYQVGRTPVPTLGLPRAARAGVRVTWR
jgi:outer membrane receptor protein involved in Fe transport